MPKRTPDKPDATRGSAGLLVLGMHRSGTSALARVLDLCGADIGVRILGGSAGNESGHWEDALAVEIHERLLAAHGTSWNEPFGLPADWRDGAAARVAGGEVRAYLVSNRDAHPLWAVKDPRLSLFANLWIDSAQAAGQGIGAVLLLRHPLEVVASLAARDGIGRGRGLLLWLEYTLAAVAAAERVPHVVLGYGQLLDDWKGCIEQVRRLPGGAALRTDQATSRAVGAFLDRSRRHHHQEDDATMPEAVARAWLELSGFLGQGQIPPGTSARLAAGLAPIDELLRPVLDEARIDRRLLWKRIGQAEGRLTEATSISQTIPANLEALRDAVERHHLGLVEAFSGNVKRMQEVAAEAQQAAAARASEATLAKTLSAGIGQLTESVESKHVSLVNAISVELRQMQSVTADAVRQSEASAREAEFGRQVGPHLQALEASLTPLALQLPVQLEQLSALAGQQHATLIEAISGDLRRMQEVTAEAVRIASLREREAELASQIAPHLQALEADIARLRADGANERARVEGERDVLRTQLDAALAQIEGFKTEIAGLQTEVVGLRAEVESGSAQFWTLSHEAGRLRQEAATLAQVLRSRSWRLTRPLRFAGRLLRGEVGGADSAAALHGWRSLVSRSPLPRSVQALLIQRSLGSGQAALPAALPDAAMATMVSLQPASPGLADVFVWAVIDWHFRTQRPQHLARALAERGHRVFYISNNFVDDAAPGFRLDPIDQSGRLFQVHLNLHGAPPIYFGSPDAAQRQALRASLGKLLGWSQTQSSISLVQHPFWSSLGRVVPNARVVYDCMDHHAGFENNSPEVLEAERGLLADADLVIVTSSWLEQEIAPQARSTALVRNAGDAAFFSTPPTEVFRDPRGRPVIGYYGAIAEWFDLELVRKLALANPDKLVLLVGNDTVDASAAFADLDNIRLVGEVPYAQLPYWLHGFDVALLPFRVIDLTMATNPVKVYEYLAAGKPVVAVDLPEMAQFDGLVRVAKDHEGFVAAVAAVLANPGGEYDRTARRKFAEGQTWAHRALELGGAITAIREPLVSVIVLTYNNLAFSQNCLFSIEHYSDYPNLEVIVVDNASSDGSPEWLRQWAEEPSQAGHKRKLVLNDSNLGFAAGNNVGLTVAEGEVLVLLNNDTYVTQGWVRTLCAHLRRDPRLGVVGPVTNNIGNEAKLDIAYDDIVDMHRLAGIHTRAHAGQSIPLRTAAFFCVAIPRRVYEVVGDLDEAFGVGFFEDDDYCRRVEEAGWSIACAEDVFVHHHLSATFDKLKAEAKRELFEANKAIYEAKWGPWQPHEYRANA